MDQDLIRQFLNTKVNSMAVDKLKSGRVKTIYKYTKALPLTTNVPTKHQQYTSPQSSVLSPQSLIFTPQNASGT